MEGQIELPDYLATCDNRNLLPALAEGLINYCKIWNYDKVDRLMEKRTADGFLQIFCNITYTHYFEHYDDWYGAEFSKKEKIVQIHKCGKYYEDILLECPIEEVVERLVEMYDRVN